MNTAKTIVVGCTGLDAAQQAAKDFQNSMTELEIAVIHYSQVIGIEDVSEEVRQHEMLVEDFEDIAGFSEEEANEAACNVAFYDEVYLS